MRRGKHEILYKQNNLSMPKYLIETVDDKKIGRKMHAIKTKSGHAKI